MPTTRRRPGWLRPVLMLVVVGIVAATFRPVLGFGFLNWDDDAVVVGNTALAGPDVMSWAFTTTHMEHYQPVSWLAWAGLKQHFGDTPAPFHAANLLAHVICALLVFVVSADVVRRAMPDASASRRDLIALAASLFFAVHPLRVEVVAWISAFPYTLALAFALGALYSWLRATDSPARGWWWIALLLFTLSLAARPVALGLPIVLIAIDALVVGLPVRRIAARVGPFAAVAAAAAIVESIARAPGVNDAPLAYRLQAALAAPMVYVWHSIAPLNLTPLDLLPAQPRVDAALIAGALVVIATAIVIAWRSRNRWPWLAVAAFSYLALLAPAAGLVSSGLQATADRYTYLPGVVLAIAVMGTAGVWASARAWRDWMVAAGALAAIAASIAMTERTLVAWSDSISLWSRVVALDASSDVALYNLGTALAAAGRGDEAAARYREALALQPQHAAAKANLDRLDAARFEREGNEAAAAGKFAEAAENYRRAVALDNRRLRAQAGLGMSLASLGRDAEAIPPLRAALASGVEDAEIANTLAGLLAQTGQPREARAVLERALALHQTDINLGHNLARLLVTDPQFAASDAPLALRLATAIVDATGGRDARALDTLAAAFAINGRRAEAAATSERAAKLAAEQGDHGLAVQITARGRAYRNPGR